MNTIEHKLTEKNFMDNILKFRDRQAGISMIYHFEKNRYTYNAYCLETELLKELVSQEYEYLTDALEFINSEFGTWELKSFTPSSNCSSCVAK